MVKVKVCGLELIDEGGKKYSCQYRLRENSAAEQERIKEAIQAIQNDGDINTPVCQELLACLDGYFDEYDETDGEEIYTIVGYKFYEEDKRDVIYDYVMTDWTNKERTVHISTRDDRLSDKEEDMVIARLRDGNPIPVGHKNACELSGHIIECCLEQVIRDCLKNRSYYNEFCFAIHQKCVDERLIPNVERMLRRIDRGFEEGYSVREYLLALLRVIAIFFEEDIRMTVTEISREEWENSI